MQKIRERPRTKDIKRKSTEIWKEAQKFDSDWRRASEHRNTQMQEFRGVSFVKTGKNKSARNKAAEKAVELESALLKSVHYRW